VFLSFERFVQCKRASQKLSWTNPILLREGCIDSPQSRTVSSRHRAASSSCAPLCARCALDANRFSKEFRRAIVVWARRPPRPYSARVSLDFVGTLAARLQTNDVAKLEMRRPGMVDAGSAYRTVTGTGFGDNPSYPEIELRIQPFVDGGVFDYVNLRSALARSSRPGSSGKAAV